MKPEVADEICKRLADGESLRAICRTKGMPSETHVRRLVVADSEFGAQYARAREIGYDRMAEEIAEIADTPKIGVIRTTKADGGVEEKEADMIEHRRLQVDARKWLLSKMLPKKYGDKLDLNHSGSVKVEKVERAIVDPKN
jgi:hypothetical protein